MADTRAHAAIAAEIKAGRMVKPADLVCVDCGGRAAVYDHFLGYARPHWLDVEPVCISCNAKRAWRTRDLSPAEVSAVAFRIPTWLVAELDSDARSSGRSRNSQLIWLLQQAYPEAAANHPERLIRGTGPRFREDAVEYDALVN
jgi:hypothetical protein